MRSTLWLCLWVALAVALSAHLLLACLFKPMQPAAKASVEHARFTAMLNPDGRSARNSLFFGDELRYGDPTLFAKPDDKLGFSAYKRYEKEKAQVPDELPRRPNGLFSSLRLGVYRAQASDSHPKDAERPELWLHFEAESHPPPLVPRLHPERAAWPQWIDADGRPLGLAGAPGGEIAKRLEPMNGKSVPCALFLLTPPPSASSDLLPPKIALLKSTGFPVLDSAAERALAASYQAFPKEGRHGDASRLIIFKPRPDSVLQFPAESHEKEGAVR
jgi:hypothetical protein